MFNLDTLPNNLKVVSSHIPGLQSVVINILIKIGSRYEAENQSGICHFLEHMAFKGTKTRSYLAIAQAFDAIGGHFNAYTSKEYTVYYAKVLSKDLKIAFDLLADILTNSTFEQEQIDKELKVILQEIAEAEDNHEDLVDENLRKTAFSNQNLGKPILGNAQTLETFDGQSFHNYINEHYHGNNMIISAAGNINHQELLTLTTEYFGHLSSKELAPYQSASFIAGSKIVKRDLEQTNIMLGFPSVSYMQENQLYKAQILSLIFGGGFSSRLFQNIREKHALVYSVGSFNSPYSDIGLFCIYASSTPENIEKFIEQTAVEISDICSNISELELSRAKEQIAASMQMAEESANYRCEDLAKSFAIYNKYTPLSEVLEEINAVTTGDLVSISQQIFHSTPVLSVVGPGFDLEYEEVVKILQHSR
jgi:predicted Zn-dependent peptidase